MQMESKTIALFPADIQLDAVSERVTKHSVNSDVWPTSGMNGE